MDSVVHLALEEICCEGANGLHLQDLWPKLRHSLAAIGLPLCPNVKRIVWESLVEVPGLHFMTHEATFSAEDVMKRSVEECEHVKILAPEAMRKCFLGIYEIEASEYSLSDTQRLILERLAAARKNGIAQNDLAKQLRIPANNVFYQLKKLETQGLIVRQPTVIRKKEASNNGESKSDSIVTTNMLYLYRYGKHLSCQQRIEITKEDNLLVDSGVADGLAKTNDDFGEDTAKVDEHVIDFLPALRAICDKLEKAEGKVLVVSDLKRDLGYLGTSSGHKAWRKICDRLKDARVVEECCTMVNKKEVNCLRLLQSFSPSHFEPKLQGCRQNDNDMEQSMTLVKRGQITEQVVELPILRQVYDMIDAEGSKGLTNTEVCRKLGLCRKEYHKRIFNKMFSRFGFHLQAESHDRGVVYRVRTPGNFNPESSKMESSSMAPIAKDLVLREGLESNSRSLNLDFHENLSQPLQVVDNLASLGDFTNINDNENVAVITEPSNGMIVSGEGKSMELSLWNQQNPDIEPSNTVSDEKLQLVVSDSGTNNAMQETSLPAVVSCRRRRSNLNYPCLTVGAINTQREQRILQMLQEEKFLIKPELHRHLESLEKEKTTMMDRKTLERSLNKLQQEGHCKCIHVSVPVVTNCGRNRTIDVVLHPSVSVSAELLGQIHDKQRAFERQLRAPSNFHKRGRSVPMLDNVQRIPNSIRLDVQSERSEAMHANGFVLAKMVRAKLLHIFIWGWVCSSPSWNDAFLSSNQAHDLKNPHSTYKLFDLDRAIKSMQLQLFLQVVGSAQKFKDMVEKSRSGLQLSDLPMNEYKGLVDTRAIGRLSCLIDILRRLKLIRLVSNGHAEDGTRSGPHTTLTHALEFKPYIEEPVSVIASSGFLFPDLRPQIRHDFVLSTRKTVDEYWNTLEYCYAVVEPRTALHAFPGSAVQEVFHSRSWASAQVMTAGQRADLLKCVAKYDSTKRLSFTECEKIAKDLDLSLEQVLRVHYDKKVRRLTRFQRVLDAEGHEVKPIKHKSIFPSGKGKNHSHRVSSKLLKPTIADGQSSLQMKNYDPGNNLEDSEDPDLNEKDNDARMCIYNRALSSLKQRKRKFSWTEEADRQLVIEYARHRAALGAKFHRLNWASIPNLPAHPDTCKRRMALLKTSVSFRKVLMKLCTLLAERFSKYLKQYQDQTMNYDDPKMMVRDYASVEDGKRSSVPESWKWDDFDANNIKVVLGNVLRHKRMAKLESVKDVFSDQDYMEDEVGDWIKASGRKSSSTHQPRKYVKLSNGSRVSRQMHKSAAIANAAELFKLIFLSTSTATEVPALLAETLRHYSEHDLFAAFNYLREKKLMIGGNCNKPFVLSHHFLHSISLSPFPMDTGKRASKFSNWLIEREKDLMEEGVDVPEDLQCGEVLNLCARVSLGELSVTPYLPPEGVGEAEDNRTSKRKPDSGEPSGASISKKSKTSFVWEGEVISRREKGFPGIKLHLLRETIPRLHVIESFKDDTCASSLFGAQNQSIMSSVVDVDYISSHSDIEDQVREIFDCGRSIHLTIDGSESPWEAMASYAENLMPSCTYDVKNLFLHPKSFKTLYLAIQKSGDEGLSMKEISEVLNIQGVQLLHILHFFTNEQVLEIMVEVLEAFGRALKVNAYDSVHVIDSLYRSKYFLTSVAEIRHDFTHLQAQTSKIENGHMTIDAVHHSDDAVASENGNDMNSNEVHRVTILNQSEDVADLSAEILSEDKITHLRCVESFPPKRKGCRPLLTWMNGDGTVNELVYKGLVRRVLGIVMQNPGILEDSIVKQMHCLNPQSCRKLLEILMMDNHIFMREMRQTSSNQPPSILGSLLADRFTKSKNFFANPASSYLL